MWYFGWIKTAILMDLRRNVDVRISISVAIAIQISLI